MECNKDEAVRVKQLAETRMQTGEFVEALKFANKAKKLHPDVENIAQILAVCEVHNAALKKLSTSEMDWYGILQTKSLSEEAIIKKQYRKLALLLHPDKNKFAGAEAAFKLIGEANTVLTDQAKRSLYDMKVKAHVRDSVRKTSSHHSNGNVFAANQVPDAATYWKNYFSNSPLWKTSSNPPLWKTSWKICTHCNFRFPTLDINIMNQVKLCPKCKNLFIPFATSQQAAPSSVPFGAPKVAPMQAPPKPFHDTIRNVFLANQVRNAATYWKNHFPNFSWNPHLKAAQQKFWTICGHCNFRFSIHIFHLNKAIICQNCKSSFIALASSYQAAPPFGPFGAASNVAPTHAPPKPASKSNVGGCADTFVRSYPSCMKTCANGVSKQHKDEKSKDGYVPVSKPMESQSSNNVRNKRVRQPENYEDDDYADVSSKKPRQNESLNKENYEYDDYADISSEMPRQNESLNNDEVEEKNLFEDCHVQEDKVWESDLDPRMLNEENCSPLNSNIPSSPEIIDCSYPYFNNFEKDWEDDCFGVKFEKCFEANEGGKCSNIK